MRISIVHPHSVESVSGSNDILIYTGGANAYCKMLSDLGHTCELLTLHHRNRIEEAIHVEFGHKIIKFPVTLGAKFGKEHSISLLQYLWKNDTEIVHIRGYKQYNIAPIVLLLSLKGTPFVLHNLGGPKSYYQYRHSLLIRMFLKLLNRADMILSVNKQELKELEKVGINPQKLKFIPIGVDTSLFYPMEREKALQHLQLDPNKIYLLYVGRIVPLKGLPFLLKAMRLICTKFKNVQLLIVGNGDKGELARLKTMARQLGIVQNVVFVGHKDRKELVYYYNAAAICVSPSLSEGFSNTVLEALACCTPFIGTMAHMDGELLQDNTNCLLVETGSAQQLAFAIQKLLDHSDLASKLAQRGYCRVVSDFTFSKIGKELEEIYKSITSKCR